RDPIPSAGPYYLASNEGGVVAVARRNPNYHGPRPHQLDAIAFQSQTDVSQAIRAITAGKADYIAPPASPLSGDQLASRYGAQAGGKRRYFRTALLGVDELAFNTTRGIFANPSLRRAANFALDRPAMAAALDDLPDDRYLPPGIPGYHS